MRTPDRARAYLETLPRAISGQRGHAATFAAACRLVEFALGEREAWQILSEWNQTHCQPPWSERELRHKLNDALRCTSPKKHLAEPASVQFPSLQPRAPSPIAPRLSLPLLHPATPDELARLANLRGLSREAVALASEKGLLRFGVYQGQPAWLVLDGSRRVAQARRLDGKLWANSAKAWTLPGSQGAWPVGIGEAGMFPAVALVEGGPDLLAVCTFLLAEHRELDCAPVAMLGGSARIHANALPMFTGKRVRLFPHFDETGDQSASRWAEQLAEVGADVDAFSLAKVRRTDGGPVKDLCDLAAIHADDFEQDRSLWAIFP